jgi:hypothetical protein
VNANTVSLISFVAQYADTSSAMNQNAITARGRRARTRVATAGTSLPNPSALLSTLPFRCLHSVMRSPLHRSLLIDTIAALIRQGVDLSHRDDGATTTTSHHTPASHLAPLEMHTHTPLITLHCKHQILTVVREVLKHLLGT